MRGDSQRLASESSNGHRWDQVALRVAFTNGLDGNERLVLLGLATTGNWKTGAALKTAPSIEQLADYAGLSRATVTRTLDALRAKGWIKTTRRRRSAAMHSINLNCLDTVPVRLAKVPECVTPIAEVPDGSIKDAHGDTPNAKDAHSEPSNTVSSVTVSLQDGFKDAHSEPIFTDQRTKNPSTERSDQNKFPDQEPALRASPPPGDNKNDENPKAKPDPPSVDFTAIRNQLGRRPIPAPLSHRQRVVARRAAHA